MKANNSFWFNECEDHIQVETSNTSNTMSFKFTSERPVDNGLLLTVGTKKEGKNYSLEYDLTLNSVTLATDSGKEIEPQQLMYLISDLVNDTFSLCPI